MPRREVDSQPLRSDATNPSAESAAASRSRTSSPSPSSPSPVNDKWFSRLLLGLGLGIAVWAGLLFYGDVGEIVEATALLPLSVILTSLVLSTLNYFIRAYRWQRMLEVVGVRIPMGESTIVFLAGMSMTLTPMKVGEIVKSALLKQSRQIPIATTAPVVMAERITDLAAMVMLASVGSLSLDRGYYVAIAGTALVAGIVAVCTLRPVGEALLRLCTLLPVVKHRSASMRDAYNHLGALVAPFAFAEATVLGLLGWSTHCLALLVLVRGFPDVTFSFAESLFAYATPLLAGTLSMLPGGLGLTEASMTGLLQEMGGSGLTTAVAAASTILIRLLTFWWAIVVGIAALAIWRRRY